MNDNKKLIQVIDETIQAYQKGERLPITKQGIEYLTEIKGIVEEYQLLIAGNEALVSINKTLQGQVDELRQQPQPKESPDEELIKKIISTATSGFTQEATICGIRKLLEDK